MKKMIYVKSIFVLLGIVLISLFVKAEEASTETSTDITIVKPGYTVIVPDSENRTFLGIATRNACKPSSTACRIKN